MVLTNNIEKSQPQGECLHLAISPSQDQKVELPFLPSFLNRCPAMPWVYYLLGRTRGLWELFTQDCQVNLRGSQARGSEEAGGARWAVEEGL